MKKTLLAKKGKYIGRDLASTSFPPSPASDWHWHAMRRVILGEKSQEINIQSPRKKGEVTLQEKSQKTPNQR